VANERTADRGGYCARTLFALHEGPLCSFLPHFARESGSMFFAERESLLQDPCRCLCRASQGWRCLSACQTATSASAFVNIVD
jgi:hypothetical protein